MQTKVDTMKKEQICYYFDRCFKGKVDSELFNEAKTCLFYLIASDGEVNLTNLPLREFTKVYYEMHSKVEKKLERMEKNYKKIDFSKLNFLQKRGCKKELENMRKLYSNFGKFNSIFINAYGISLVNVIDSIRIDNLTDQIIKEQSELKTNA